MQFTPETPRAELTIQGAAFTVPEPFTVGHTVSENEAAALNQLLRENTRNNFAGKVAEALKAVGGSVEGLDLAALQTELDTYLAGYEFGVRKIGTRVPADPIQREAQKIAAQLIRQALRKKGIKVSEDGANPGEITEAKFSELVEAAMARPDIQDAAKVRHAATQSLATLDLSSAA